MPLLARNVMRTLVRLGAGVSVEDLKRRSAHRLQRVARKSVQRLASRWSSWARVLYPRQRQAVTTAVGRPGRGAVQPSAAPSGQASLSDLESPDWNAREQAVMRLAGTQTEQALEGLIAALRDPSAEVALSAVGALAGREGPRVLSALEEVVRNPEGFFSPFTRAAAVEVLAERLEDGALSLVLDAVHDVDSEVSLAAIAAVSRRSPATAAVHLLPILRDQSGYFLAPVRRAAARVLRATDSLSESERAELLETESDAAIRSLLSADFLSGQVA